MLNRRNVLKAGALSAIAAPFVATGRPVASASETDPTFVLVHGAWHGGWCWDRVVPLLTAAGVRFTAPTLTGLGERAHLIDRSVDLDTHVEDIVNHIAFEELENVILVGHSYAGFPAALAAARMPETVSQLILLDSYFPTEGETILDHLGPDLTNDFNAKAAADVNWNIAALPAEAFGLEGDNAKWVNSLLTPHPFATHAQPANFAGPLPDRTYVQCSLSTIADIFQRSRDNVAKDGGFEFVQIEAGHDVMVDQPELLTETLLAIAH